MPIERWAVSGDGVNSIDWFLVRSGQPGIGIGAIIDERCVSDE